MNAKSTVLLGATLLLAGVLAGCVDNGSESTNVNDPGPDGECDNRNLVDDDVVSDDDGTTLGECEENAADR